MFFNTIKIIIKKLPTNAAIIKILSKSGARISTTKNRNNIHQNSIFCHGSLKTFKNLNSVLIMPSKNISNVTNIMTVTLTFSKKSAIYSPKRYMYTLTRIRNLLYRGNINKNVNPMLENPTKIINRSHTNWTGRVRLEDCKYEPNPPSMEFDSETKLEIMRPYDASGKNHVLLIDENFKHDKFYLVSGSFTTSSTFYKDIPPEMVAGFTLEGSAKPQFLHRYETPRLIKKSDVIMHDEATMCLQSPEYSSYLNNLPSKSNYP